MPSVLTEYWDEERAVKSRLVVSREGLTSAGRSRTKGYVMEPDTGEMPMFDFSPIEKKLTPEQAKAARQVLIDEKYLAIKAQTETFLESQTWREELDSHAKGKGEEDPEAELLPSRAEYEQLVNLEIEVHAARLTNEPIGKVKALQEEAMSLQTRLRAAHPRVHDALREALLCARELDHIRNKAERLGKDPDQPDAAEVLHARHHSSPLAGKDVAAAGHLKTDAKSRIVSINNLSGHYKPAFVHLLQAVEGLLKRGALQDTGWVSLDDAGRVIPPTASQVKLLDLVQRLHEDIKQARLALVRAQAGLKRLQSDPGSAEFANRSVAELEADFKAEADRAQACISAYDNAAQALTDSGLQRANRILRPGDDGYQAEVVFLDGADKKSALDVVTSEADLKPSSLGEFLTSGGNAMGTVREPGTDNKVKVRVADLREQMHAELKRRPQNDAANSEADERHAKVMAALAKIPKLDKSLYDKLLAKSTRLTAAQLEELATKLELAAARLRPPEPQPPSEPGAADKFFKESSMMEEDSDDEASPRGADLAPPTIPPDTSFQSGARRYAMIPEDSPAVVTGASAGHRAAKSTAAGRAYSSAVGDIDDSPDAEAGSEGSGPAAAQSTEIPRSADVPAAARAYSSAVGDIGDEPDAKTGPEGSGAAATESARVLRGAGVPAAARAYSSAVGDVGDEPEAEAGPEGSGPAATEFTEVPRGADVPAAARAYSSAVGDLDNKPDAQARREAS